MRDCINIFRAHVLKKVKKIVKSVYDLTRDDVVDMSRNLTANDRYHCLLNCVSRNFFYMNFVNINNNILSIDFVILFLREFFIKCISNLKKMKKKIRCEIWRWIMTQKHILSQSRRARLFLYAARYIIVLSNITLSNTKRSIFKTTM